MCGCGCKCLSITVIRWEAAKDLSCWLYFQLYPAVCLCVRAHMCWLKNGIDVSKSSLCEKKTISIANKLINYHWTWIRARLKRFLFSSFNTHTDFFFLLVSPYSKNRNDRLESIKLVQFLCICRASLLNKNKGKILNSFRTETVTTF